MPLAPQVSVLAQEFLILFDPELAPVTTPDSAKTWAKSYVQWCLAGGIPEAKAREPVLASALTVAFNPELGGGGPALFTQALLAFWMGMTIPEQAGIVVSFLPTGSTNSPQPDDATPLQQAQGLAQTISAFTLGAVKVQSPPTTGPIVPLL